LLEPGSTTTMKDGTTEVLLRFSSRLLMKAMAVYSHITSYLPSSGHLHLLTTGSLRVERCAWLSFSQSNSEPSALTSPSARMAKSMQHFIGPFMVSIAMTQELSARRLVPIKHSDAAISACNPTFWPWIEP